MAKTFQPRGIIPAMVTPLTSDDTIDVAGLTALTRHLIEGGCHGLFSVGSQGEFWALTAEEKQLTWETVVAETNGQIPVYAGSNAVTTREAVVLTQLAERCGVDAVSVLTPFFISPTDDQLFAHYRAIADASSLPVVLYANPARTAVKLSVDLVARLAEVPGIVGIKDSSGDLGLTAAYIGAVPATFSVLMGNDALILASLIYGTKGAIAATANVVPDMVVAIYDLFLQGDIGGARQAQDRLAALRRAFTWGTFPVVIKEALDLIGLPAGPARAPVGPLTDDQRQRLRQLLVSLDQAVVA
ncbi:MAG TPA: 4-hydroxy-tetrahydrodipicolinate synthase [Anaerolineales bacterium]|jgi:4-hydroxy-tetrahydrodipicolinate synthase